MADMKHERPKCDRCEDKGWYFRVPSGFNPFLAGGFNTAKAMYRVTCRCAADAQADSAASKAGA